MTYRLQTMILSSRQTSYRRPSAWEARMATGGVNELIKLDATHTFCGLTKKLVTVIVEHILKKASTKNNAQLQKNDLVLQNQYM